MPSDDKGVPIPQPFNQFCCPKCGSENTGRFPALHEGGVTHSQSDSTHAAVAVTGDGFMPVLGRSSTSGVQQTELARKTAPPGQRKVYGVGALVVTLLLSPVIAVLPWMIVTFLSALILSTDTAEKLSPWIMGLSIGLVVAGAIGMYSDGRKHKAWNATEYPQIHQEWSRKWLCLRCGEAFSPSS